MNPIRLAAGTILALLAAVPARAGTEEVVHTFSGTDGAGPAGGLVAIGGVLYGTTFRGGAGGSGTAFSVTAQGSFRVLHAFQGAADGAVPVAGLARRGRELFGTTSANYSSGLGDGTAFMTSIDGSEQFLAQFDQRTGTAPASSLVPVGDALYGTTRNGGIGGDKARGTFFKLGFDGVIRPVHTFLGGSDGSTPSGDLLYENGVFYGATQRGGSGGTGRREGFGTIFSITPDGQEAVLHAFNGMDGYAPNGGLLDVGGTLYGTTMFGGRNLDRFNGAGTVFKLAPDGTLTTLHVFDNLPDGGYPNGNLVNLGGTLYGTTQDGGANNFGSIFSVAPDGTVAIVYSFPCCNGRHGVAPEAGLTVLNGALYGTTVFGGDHNYGTVFRYRP